MQSQVTGAYGGSRRAGESWRRSSSDQAIDKGSSNAALPISQRGMAERTFGRKRDFSGWLNGVSVQLGCALSVVFEPGISNAIRSRFGRQPTSR
jgi:hypothetical protein